MAESMKRELSKNVIFIGVGKWGDMRIAAEHMAEEFARRGYQVIYLCAAVDLLLALRDSFVRKNNGFLKDFFRALFRRDPLRDIEPNLVIAPGLALLAGFGLFRLCDCINEFILWMYIERLAKKKGMRRYVLYSFQYFPTRKRGGHCEYFVYDCIDNWQSMSGSKRRAARIGVLEKCLVQNVDLWFAISQPLLEQRKQWNVDGYLELPSFDKSNFIDYRKNSGLAAKMSEFSRPIIGMTSTIFSKKIDWQFLLFAAEAKKNYTFLMVGPCMDTPPEEIRALKNVFFLGPQPFRDIPYIIECLDVALILFRQNAFGNFALPTKFLEYLWMGKAVVSTDLQSLRPFRDIIDLAVDREDFVKKIDHCLTTDSPARREQRTRFAGNFSKEMRAQRILNRLVAEFEKKGDGQ
ncbi:MAG: glycosyltransferase [Candidatus Omnitrophica bacterium]|nr:glycosyltransferase [Candidatus Omnitrophota bacterium]